MIVSLGPAQMTGLNPALAMWLSQSYDADWQKVALSQLVEFVSGVPK